MDAVTSGYEMGKRTEPLLGVDWQSLFDEPLADVRVRFGLDGARIVGEGIPAARPKAGTSEDGLLPTAVLEELAAARH